MGWNSKDAWIARETVADKSDGLNCISTNIAVESGVSHLDRPTPFDDMVIHRDRLIFGSPFKATMMYHSKKAGGNSSKTKGEICCPDTYLVVNNFWRPCKEMDFVHVITISSFPSACITEPGEVGTSSSCGWSSGQGASSFTCSCSPHSRLGLERLLSWWMS